MDNNDQEIKCISISLCGNSAIGKTSIYRNYFGLPFIETQLISIGNDKMIGKIKIHAKKKKLKYGILLVLKDLETQ